MGAITFSIDSRLIEALKGHLPFDVFVETGTFQGNTIEIVKPYFNTIYSVELSDHYYEKAVEKFGDDPSLTLIHDDAARALKMIVPTLNPRPVIFWLDAHWCVANATAGELSQCPLLEELHAIEQLNHQSMIIIDDARLFLATPQAPHEVSNWPTFHEIIQTLFKLSCDHQLAVVNDCILFFPKTIEASIKSYACQYGIDWLDVLNRCRDTEAMLIAVNQDNDRLLQENLRLKNNSILQLAKRLARVFLKGRNARTLSQKSRVIEE